MYARLHSLVAFLQDRQVCHSSYYYSRCALRLVLTKIINNVIRSTVGVCCALSASYYFKLDCHSIIRKSLCLIEIQIMNVVELRFTLLLISLQPRYKVDDCNIKESLLYGVLRLQEVQCLNHILQAEMFTVFAGSSN